jgi:hypothetical protein
MEGNRVRECKPFCVNPAAFQTKMWVQAEIHISKSLNAVDRETENGPLVRDQVFTFSTVLFSLNA